MKLSRLIILLAVLAIVPGLFTIPSCNNKDPKPNGPDTVTVKVDVPQFNADSAYTYIGQQVAFGPRVPGTAEHAACAEWLTARLQAYSGGHVIVQKVNKKLFAGQTVEIKNIIATFNPEVKRRILLCAHWDTRMFADHDSEKRDEPILGANDGGSGVGVLLEVARQLAAKPLNKIGVDVIFFDAEDQGVPDNMPQYTRPQNPNETWCIGSQHWSQHRHRMDYSYVYGILLDMVGAEGAEFPREANSNYYAQKVLDKVWKEGAALGYGRYFIKDAAGEILDDHYFINTLASIPTIDIIDLDPRSGKFHSSWHTHADDMSVISKETLQAVGQTVLSVVCKEAAGAVAL